MVKPAAKLPACREKSSRRTEPVVEGTESLKSLDNRTSKVAFRDSRSACLAFAVFYGSHGSAEEGRDDNSTQL